MATTRATVGVTTGAAQDAYAYPPDLARFVRVRWDDCPGGVEGSEYERGEAPDAQVLETLLSTCYQASLLREEERPVAFRAILASPEDLPEDGGPPEGLHRMEFDEPRPFDERELRRLSPAADYERSLIGVCRDGDGELKIWGIVHSGSRWLRVRRGGRQSSAPPPPALMVKVEGPGRLGVKKGSAFLAALADGGISDSYSDIFPSRWLSEMFAPTQDELLELHDAARLEAAAVGERWASLDPQFPRMIARQMYRRLVSTLAEARHGGAIIMVPPERTEEILAGKHVTLKHSFADGEPRRRLRTLILRIMNHLARANDGAASDSPVGWDEYAWSDDPKLADLDEAVFEFAHLVASYASVDGAVVMTHRHELIGFGGEISGDIEPVLSVHKALDPEGENTVEESAEDEGTRHRSAYRLAGAMPDALLVVVSQDGNTRFVSGRNGMVTCWDQA